MKSHLWPFLLSHTWIALRNLNLVAIYRIGVQIEMQEEE